MSRRTRALGFLGAALACALLAALVASSYRSRVEASYGELRPVVVATADLRVGVPIGPAEAKRALAVRRVPARFAPATALRHPADALGRAPMGPVPAGAYLLGVQLEVPQPESPSVPGVGHGRRPVEVGVSGAGALLVGGGSPEGARVDVVISQPSGLGNRARTWIAATGVRLLALEGPGGQGEGWTATLALSRSQALELIAADSSGRQIRLLPLPEW